MRDKQRLPSSMLPSLTGRRVSFSSTQEAILRAMQDHPTTQAENREICRELTMRLEDIVTKKAGLKTLFLLQGNEAQRALDYLRALLSYSRFPATLRGDIIVAMQRLAKRRNLSPRKLDSIKVLDKSPLHRGGFAEVYRGLYQEKMVCVKKPIPRTRSPQEKATQLCVKEGILWGSLNHPNILQFIGVCELDGHSCLISPWAGGGAIMDYLKEYPDANRMEFAADMSQGLKYLHSLSVIHGDIKPANVLIKTSGNPRAVLADFGISSLSGEGIVEMTSFSDVHSIGGTLRWQAPELLAATKRIPNTRESDIWALGCTFYEVFVGKTPYSEIRFFDMKDHVVNQGKRPERPDEESPAWREYGLNKWIWLLFQKCWRTEPKDRPSIERIARTFYRWAGRDVQSAARSPRKGSPPLDRVEVSNQLESLKALEGLMAAVGSTDGQLTEPSTPEPDDGLRERGRQLLVGRKHRRSFPEREDRVPKRVRLSRETRLRPD